MKKFLLVAFVVGMSFSAIGCGSKDATATSVGTKAQTVTTSVKDK